MAVNYKKIVTIGGLENFKTRQDTLNESKFIKRTDINVDNNYIANVTVTHADDPANDEVVQLLTPQSAISAGNINGVLSINNIPAAAIEKIFVVANDEARFALTDEQVQVGDTVKVINPSKKMYMVKDIEHLDNEDGYEEYEVGIAARVPWSGVEGKPEAYTPSNHASNKVTSMDGYETTLSSLETTMEGIITTAEIKEPAQRTEAEEDALEGKVAIENTDSLNTAVSKLTWMLDKCRESSRDLSYIEDMFATNAEIDEGVFSIVASSSDNEDPGSGGDNNTSSGDDNGSGDGNGSSTEPTGGDNNTGSGDDNGSGTEPTGEDNTNPDNQEP